MTQPQQHKLSLFQVWAITVGMVISGQYFGWNFAFKQARLSEVLIGTACVIVFYSLFMYLYVTAAKQSPRSGGPMVLIEALGYRTLARLTGVVAFMEFLFGVSAIALAAGAYLHVLVSVIPPLYLSLLCLVLCGILNWRGITVSTQFEITVTVAALAGLMLFLVLSITPQESHLFLQHMSTPRPFHCLLAIPFLLWLLLGIEGSVLTAEECIKPSKTLPRAVLGALVTLGVCAVFIVIQVAILLPASEHLSLNPLPAALHHVAHTTPAELALIVTLGGLGIIASLNGLLIAASRQLYGLMQRMTHNSSMRNTAKNISHCTVITTLLAALLVLTVRQSVLLQVSILSALTIYTAVSISLQLQIKKEKSIYTINRHATILVLLMSIALLGICCITC
jgi:ethanolamine permease